MPNAVDFSWERPDASSLLAQGLGAFVYDKSFGNQGPPEEYRSQLAAAGVTTAGVHEEDGSESFESDDDYAHGVRAAQRADATFAPGTLVYYCAADLSNVDGREPEVSNYFRGVGDTTREPTVGAYGPLGALRAAQAGHPKVRRLWGVETWHPDAYNNGDPRNVELWRAEGVHVLQMVGEGPIPGTDLDLVLQESWASMGDATIPPKRKHSDMQILASKRDSGPTAGVLEYWLVIGNIPTQQFVGTPAAFGIPQDAIDFSAAEIPIRRVADGTIDLLSTIAHRGQVDEVAATAAGGVTLDQIKQLSFKAV